MMSVISRLSYAGSRLIAVALGCAFLSGCSLFSPTPAPAPEPVEPSPLVAYMIAHQPGDSTTLSDPEFGTDILVTMQEDFISASGSTCKRASLLARLKESEMAVICQDADGQWILAPRIWGQGIRP